MAALLTLATFIFLLFFVLYLGCSLEYFFVVRAYDTASTGQITMPSSQEIRVQNLEDKVTSQGDKLDHIVKLLNDLSEKKSTS